jgi:hypothetical protein
MMSNQITILFSLICLILVSHSWWVHYKVKDGIARIMLLWGCGLIFFFLLFRIINIFLFDAGVINIEQSRALSLYNVCLIYAIVIGQQFIQRGHVQRDEDDELQKDKKELRKFRREKK